MKSSNRLTREEEVALFKAGRTDEVIAAHVGFVHSIARRYAKNRDALFDDLVQEGSIGMMRAAKTFDPDRGVLFVTYAKDAIAQAMAEHVRRIRRLVIVPRDEGRKAIIAMARSKIDSPEALGEHLDVSAESAHSLFLLLASNEASLYRQDRDGGEYEWIANDSNPETEAMIADVARIIRRVVAKGASLTELERKVIEVRYLSGEFRTLREVSEIMGAASKQRTDNVERAALLKLSKKLKHVA